jgi:energy-coupling factor transporter ATP-binding protein EcfA2
MRIKSIFANDVLPVRKFEIENLGEVVVIAGQNGVGKTRLVAGMIARFQNPTQLQAPGSPGVRFILEPTSDDEREKWQAPFLDTANQDHLTRLSTTLSSNKRRNKWESGVLHFESDRTISQVQPYQFNWDAIDPWSEPVSWNLTFGGLRARYQDTIHALFRKVQSHDRAISKRARELEKAGTETMALNFGDPLKLFKETFHQLVGPKELLDFDPRTQQLSYMLNGQTLRFDTLSSGEREIVNIVFDFLLREPSDCVIFFDEPELHLHPELSYRLLQTLKFVGKRNQFIFCTHSPDVITASLENTVVFIGPPRENSDGKFENQAIEVKDDDETNTALRLLGQSIGIVSLGKKIVLIEGNSSSTDKLTYGSILKNRFPSLVLAPSGGRSVVESFRTLTENVLSRTVWGVDFFMLCDRDVTDVAEPIAGKTQSSGRLRYLKRYHLENYFLDPTALSKVFEKIEAPNSWLVDPQAVDDALKSLAIETVPYAVGLVVAAKVRQLAGNVSIMPKGLERQSVDELIRAFEERIEAEQSRIQSALVITKIETLIRDTYETMINACSSEEWRSIIPGKPILSRFAKKANLELGRLKLGYLNAVEENSMNCFQDIIEIFSAFENYTP